MQYIFVKMDYQWKEVIGKQLPITDKVTILEKYISGRELTTAIVDNTPLGVTEIITKDWYDYDSKYIEGRSTHIVPANIPNEITELCKKYALKTVTFSYFNSPYILSQILISLSFFVLTVILSFCT